MKLSKSILLIEDDIDDQEFFLDAISKIENVHVSYVACNGSEALERLRTSINLPDFIFSDVQMPGMDGIECLTEIKRNSRTQNIPVVMLSSSVAQSGVVCALGAKAFIKKTFDFKSLCQQLDKMINSDFVVATAIPAQSLQRMLTAA